MDSIPRNTLTLSESVCEKTSNEIANGGATQPEGSSESLFLSSPPITRDNDEDGADDALDEAEKEARHCDAGEIEAQCYTFVKLVYTSVKVMGSYE